MNLTGRAFALAALITLLGIAGQWGPPILAGLWRLPAAFMVLALTAEALLVRRQSFQAMREVPATLHLGRPSPGHWQVTNPHSMPLHLVTLERLPQGLEGNERPCHWRVGAGRTAREDFNLTARRLGEITWSHWYVRQRGVFALAWWTRNQTLPSSVGVVPDRLHGAERTRPTAIQAGDLNARSRGQGTELMGLRPYQPGDPLRSLDWKATARARRPVVRLFTEERRLSLMLLLDAGLTSELHYGGLSRLGHFVNVAARLGERALGEGGQVGLIAFSDRVLGHSHNLKGTAGLRQLRRQLAGLAPQPVQANPLTAALHLRRLVAQRSLVVLLTDVDLGVAGEQLHKAVDLLKPKHLPLTVGLMDSEVLARTSRPAHDWLDPYDTAAALETRHHWSVTRLRLQRQGVPVVLATPDQLDHAVFQYYERIGERRQV